jgi:hypothetical protein
MKKKQNQTFVVSFWSMLAVLGFSFCPITTGLGAEPARPQATASSALDDFTPAGAIDSDRFGFDAGKAWKGKTGEAQWWWQVSFAEPREVGSILQINGDHELVLQNAPKRYVWQWSLDGQAWHDIEETAIDGERRVYRIHRFKRSRTLQHLRLHVLEAEGKFPTLREAEIYVNTAAQIDFPDWVIAVSVIESSKLPGGGLGFVHLVRECPEWKHVRFQHVWLDSFDEAFADAEPYPLCAFLSGSHVDWCQRTREAWTGTQELLKNRNLPMWAACGGAQGLAILEDVGVDSPWDCPHCRDPNDPKLPIYTHIGHTEMKPCGDYSCCISERGRFNILQLARDPVFEGLAEEFQVMQYHCGQIEYAPKGWMMIATKGSGAMTKMQCMRVEDRPIYAAQFHIEKEGTPENSRILMSNFLGIAKQWGGYHPEGEPLTRPTLLP